MGGLLSYSIVSGLVMLAMYLAYRLFLARDNQHAFNRGVLLAIYIVSFAAVPLSLLPDSLAATSTAALTSDVDIAAVAAISPEKPVWGTVLIWIFIAGMTAVALKTASTWIRLMRVVRSGRKIERNGFTMVVTEDKRFAPFSWMRYVVIGREDFENGLTAITAHEIKHVTSRHWIDLIIAQTVCVINWFNPAAWLMRDELMLVHEYQADMAVIDNGHNPQEYQMLLIKKAVGARFPSLANSLNHSKLKKRITMMYKKKSDVGRRFKALALVPTLVSALALAGVPAVRAAVSAISDSGVTVSKDSEKLSDAKISGKPVKIFKVTNINNDGNETTVTIHAEGLGNSVSVSGGTFTTKGETYRAKSIRCDMTNGSAVIKAVFPFSSEYASPKMSIMINGEEVPFDLDRYTGDAGSASTGGDASSTDAAGDMDIYINGKKITEETLRELPSDKIASIDIDRKNKRMTITLK